jgi:hypothetical protein
VADSAIGVPGVQALLIGGRMFGRKLAEPQNSYQKFVYREFISAWKRGIV